MKTFTIYRLEFRDCDGAPVVNYFHTKGTMAAFMNKYVREYSNEGWAYIDTDEIEFPRLQKDVAKWLTDNWK